MLHRTSAMKKRAMLAASLAAIFSSALLAEQQVLINLASASGQTQGMAMVLASQMQQQGATVSVLLCDSAADLALPDHQAEMLKPMSATPGQLLAKLRQGGAKVQVCALYLPNKGLTAADLLQGITPAQPADIAKQMLAPEVKVFSF
ncbi:hypothetical protein WG68_12625 [Arsukibacterium ikkense]|uniref:Uncharacterized protein n=1 Tax=Arsukibacterium ikkense TaxID=336831 RepID=A0A0M2V352_9GAMM|nr:DsrE family protein [Arsukibacterium ikkense]KKO45071.1 hypothetical protein WG68_12625 [Arsukibacterium ikkense]